MDSTKSDNPTITTTISYGSIGVNKRKAKGVLGEMLKNIDPDSLERTKQQMLKQVPNSVFKFDIRLKGDALSTEIYTRPLTSPDDEPFHVLENEIARQYFTKERIDAIKIEFCKQILEADNPFDIYCWDTDGNYNVTEDMLFDVQLDEKYNDPLTPLYQAQLDRERQKHETKDRGED